MGALRYNEHRMTRIALLVVFRGLVSPGWGQRVPIAWERVAGGLRTPVQVTGAAAGSGRLPGPRVGPVTDASHGATNLSSREFRAKPKT
jgi:hypothetical protein